MTIIGGQGVALTEFDLQRFVEIDAGADGFTIDQARRRLIAVRFRGGVAHTIREYDIEELRL